MIFILYNSLGVFISNVVTQQKILRYVGLICQQQKKHCRYNDQLPNAIISYFIKPMLLCFLCNCNEIRDLKIFVYKKALIRTQLKNWF